MASCTLSTISHILWFLCTLFTVHTSCIPYFTAHDTLLTQMCDHSNNWLRKTSCFLVSSPLDIFKSPLRSSLVLVDLEVHTSLVRLPKYWQTLSSAWSACLRSLRASSIFCLISTLFTPNNWATASTSLCLLFCQFLLRLFLAAFFCCCFCVSLGMSQRHVPVPACWCIIAPGSRIGIFLFLILYSLGRFCMLTLDWYQLPPLCSEVLPTSIRDSQQRCAHAWNISSRLQLLLVLLWSFDHWALGSRICQWSLETRLLGWQAAARGLFLA